MSLAADLAKGHTAPTEATRYADSATDLDVVRLTNPEFNSYLTAPWLRSIARRQGFFLYSSDRGGSMQAWRMDLKTGESRLLTEAAALDPSSLFLTSGERGFYFLDGDQFKRSVFSNLKESEVYQLPEKPPDTGGVAYSDDGMYAAFVSGSGKESKLLLVNVAHKTVTTLVEQQPDLAQPAIRPRRAQVLYRRGGGLWIVDFTGRNNRQLKTPSAGQLGPARWAPNGRTVIYLHYPGEHELNALREVTPDDNTDKLISKTSQFVQFGINGDGSVFVGASRNSASPYILLLLRANRRELSLCEHKASNASLVSPTFSPDSQRIFFQSDREGKPAIYRIRVEKFVEETEG